MKILKGRRGVISLVLLLVVAATAVLIFIQAYENEEENLTANDTIVKDTVQLIYGLNPEIYNIESESVKSGENLSDILNRNGISAQDIHNISYKSSDIFDVKKFRAGNPYMLFKQKDSSNTLDYFVYEINAIDYVVYDFRDTGVVFTGKKEVDTVKKTSSGVITSSLWNSMKSDSVNPLLILDLSDIYAWVIDFYGIQQGDAYKVIYDELYVDGKSIGIGKIYAAWFNHIDKAFYAFQYEKDSIKDYYDEAGQSLRREFLKAPLKFRRISSGFSNARLHPILRVYRPHHGVDYAAAVGTPVRTIGDGTVTQKGYRGAAGHMVTIRHNSVYTTKYLHLSKYGDGIKPGARVKQGQVIGYVGSTGRSTGPHLDFRVYKNGQAINPLRMESPPAEPLPKEYMKEYKEFINSWKKELDKVKIEKEIKEKDSIALKGGSHKNASLPYFIG